MITAPIPSIVPSHKFNGESGHRPTQFFAKSLKKLFPHPSIVPLPSGEQAAADHRDSSRPV